ncbi:tRNA guanosine-2'-O-methyltransferase TRM11-like protein, partial [Ophiophagus hannah]
MAFEHSFREIQSLLSLCDGRFSSSQELRLKSPFWILDLPSEEIARRLMKRTVCAKSIFELWGHGKSVEELHSSLKNYPVEKMAPYLQSNFTYKIIVHAFNKTLTQPEKIQRIDFLPFKGRVDLNNPDHTFWFLEDHGIYLGNSTEQPISLYFGRWIANGQRELIESYSVKKRHFIGNTSMHSGLAFIMANHGKVKPNNIVFDPFVGTGGLLIASAHFGAYVCGTDIDYNIAKLVERIKSGEDLMKISEPTFASTVWRNTTLTYLFLMHQNPYGGRECNLTQSLQTLSDIIFDLLKFAAKYLVLGGRLVYWLPVYKPEYTEEIIPQHPCLKLVSNCEQTLSNHTSRYLITMEKVKEFEEDDYNSHILDSQYLQYKCHDSFREKYFCGVTKRIAKEKKDSQNLLPN